MYIDYSASISIVKQYSLAFTNTDKFNLRLVRASQYLSTFELNVRHKSEKQNLVSNALSRLLCNRENSTEQSEAKDILDALHDKLDLNRIIYVFSTILIKMSSKFRDRLISIMIKNKR